jgi:hypothetical protein
MKKGLRILIILGVVLFIGGFVYLTFKEVKPIDDTKKLYVKCGSIHESYTVYSSDEISFGTENENCSLELEVRNVDRNYIKLKSNNYLYTLDGNNVINESVLFNEIIVSADEKVVLYAMDKTTKFEFEFK